MEKMRRPSGGAPGWVSGKEAAPPAGHAVLGRLLGPANRTLRRRLDRGGRSSWVLWREGMPPTTVSPARSGGGGLRGLVLPVTIIGAILVFVVPIPPQLLDVLLSANLTVAVIVLLTT